MKAWQKGYKLEDLKALEEKFEPYNRYSLSPFTKFKKNNIAEALFKNELAMHPEGHYYMTYSAVKAKSKISTLGHLAGTKIPGEIVIRNLVVNDFKTFSEFLETRKTGTWIEIFEEDKTLKSFLEMQKDVRKVATKIASTAEIIGIYYLDRTPGYVERKFFGYPEIENIGLKPLILPTLIEHTNAIKAKLDTLPEFAIHYSNYNVKKTWSALSIIGFSDNPEFIEKPSEMNEKWWETHKSDNLALRPTKLWYEFRDLLWPLLDVFSKSGLMDIDLFERIRFMKLAAGNGKLNRHTDLVDVDSGTADGKLMRFHFPIATNSDVKFYSWNMNGEGEIAQMGEGECWYLDTRKPHAATNAGETDRIHLVVDVKANDFVRDLLTRTDWIAEKEDLTKDETPATLDEDEIVIDFNEDCYANNQPA